MPPTNNIPLFNLNLCVNISVPSCLHFPTLQNHESENFVQKKHAHALLCARKIAQIQKSSLEFISDLKFLEFVQNPLHKHWSGLGIGRIRRDSCRHERTGNCRGFRIFCRNRKRTITQLGKKDFEISKLTQTFYSFICTSEK